MCDLMKNQLFLYFLRKKHGITLVDANYKNLQEAIKLCDDYVLEKLFEKEINSRLDDFKSKLDKVYYEVRSEVVNSMKDKMIESMIENNQIKEKKYDVEKVFLNSMRILLANNSIGERYDCLILDAKSFYSELEEFHEIDKRDLNKLLKKYNAVRTQNNKNKVTILIRVDGITRNVIEIKKDFINKYKLLESREQ